MKQDHSDLIDALRYIDPSELEYGEWLAVGQGLHSCGFDWTIWDEWSKSDPRYVDGECEAKWLTFSDENAIQPISSGTIAAMAMMNGWEPRHKVPATAFGWDDAVSLVDPAYVEDEALEPMELEPVDMLVKYLETLFNASEHVCYVVEAYQKEDSAKWLPGTGAWGRTAGQIIESLKKCGGDIGAAIGDYEPAAGAWICANPVDGNGRKNDNITDLRYVLVESDTDNVEQQYGIMKALNLPLAAVVSSGNKSIHGIVHVDAEDMRQYRERVNMIFSECRKAGLHIDSSTRNPSRLSRLPGVYRNGNLQALLATDIGAKDYDAWIQWLQEEQDDLPEILNLRDIFDDMPDLARPLISDILRVGHKAILAGPSKAGKSFYLMDLALAVADGGYWAGHKCEQGKVLYVNLEIDGSSSAHRFADLAMAKETQPKNVQNVDVWNLRGKAAPIEELAPRIIRRSNKKGPDPEHGGYSLIIIDPTYKIQSGDENAAGDIARFTNELDRIANETKAALVYCHHQSKGYQGNKSSIDRMSGSGVFARDADTIIDMTQLSITEEERKGARDARIRAIVDQYTNGLDISVPPDATANAYREIVCQALGEKRAQQLRDECEQALKGNEAITAWRLSFTLREFPNLPDQHVWFDYPLHVTDTRGYLDECPLMGSDMALSTDGSGRRKGDARQENQDQLTEMFNTLSLFNGTGTVRLSEMANALGVSEKTVRRRIQKADNLQLKNGTISSIF